MNRAYRLAAFDAFAYFLVQDQADRRVYAVFFLFPSAAQHHAGQRARLLDAPAKRRDAPAGPSPVPVAVHAEACGAAADSRLVGSSRAVS